MMIHIRQRNSSLDDNKTYTVVITDDWHHDLDAHASIVEYPDLFEIVDADIPEDAQYLKYQ